MADLDPIEVPIDGVLDLHTFRPNEVKELLVDYIEMCLENKIYSIRIIHGKGTGALKELVHGQLKKNPHIQSFQLAEGNWGATSVRLKDLQ